MLEFSPRLTRCAPGERTVSLHTAPTAALYHLNAKFSRHPAFPGFEDVSESRPNLLAFLGGHPRLPLVPAAKPPATGVNEVIRARRSTRSFSGAALSSAELSALLELGAGVTGEGGEEHPGRAIPSGGAKYPVQVVVCAFHPELSGDLRFHQRFLCSV